ncbi:unnamed protein product [Closterium sp. Yama58-4]|nr:unnamed protein product [Closterium sp. Yama58-4]
MSTAAVGPAPSSPDFVPGDAAARKTGLESVMTAPEGKGCLTVDNFMAACGELVLTDHQKALVAETRELIAWSGTSTDDVDDRTVMRFLVARALAPAKSAPMYVAHRKWRTAYIPDGAPTVPMESIHTQAASDIMCLQTLPGHASWLLIRPRFHDPNTRDLDEFVRLIVYGMDAALGSSRTAGFHKCGVIIDMEGLAYRNLDTRGVIAAIAVLQNQYPERLICLFLIHVPTVFWTLWKLVSPFIDPITKRKFRFLEDKAIEETLGAAIPRKQLPSRYGGEGEFTPIRTVQLCLLSPRPLSHRDAPSFRGASPRRGSAHLVAAPLTSSRLRSPRRGSARLVAAPLASPRLRSPHRALAPLVAPPLPSSRLRSPRRASAPLVAPPLPSPRLRSPRRASAPLAAPPLPSPRLRSPRRASAPLAAPPLPSARQHPRRASPAISAPTPSPRCPSSRLHSRFLLPSPISLLLPSIRSCYLPLYSLCFPSFPVCFPSFPVCFPSFPPLLPPFTPLLPLVSPLLPLFQPPDFPIFNFLLPLILLLLPLMSPSASPHFPLCFPAFPPLLPRIPPSASPHSPLRFSSFPPPLLLIPPSASPHVPLCFSAFPPLLPRISPTASPHSPLRFSSFPPPLLLIPPSASPIPPSASPHSPLRFSSFPPPLLLIPPSASPHSPLRSSSFPPPLLLIPPSASPHSPLRFPLFSPLLPPGQGLHILSALLCPLVPHAQPCAHQVVDKAGRLLCLLVP